MRTHRFVIASLLAAACALSLVWWCAKDRPHLVERRLDSLMNDLHQRGLFDGAVVVGKGRDIIWEKGFGFANEAQRVPFTAATPTDAASLAKTFTATLVLLLHGEGILDLDAPVQHYLPELPYPDITLRHLLSHSSGLPAYYDYFEPFIPAGQVRTTDTLLGIIAERKPPLHFRPGSSFEYSSFAYDLAALAAARATGSTYGDLLQKRFFEPLEITSAFLRPARLSDFPGARTIGYRRVRGVREVNDVFDLEAFHGGSNIYISARDLHRWNSAFLSESVLATRTKNAALEFARIGNATSGLTLGSWYRTEIGDAYCYAGHLQGFHSEVFREPGSGGSIVYVSNNTLEPWLHPAIIRAIRSILKGNDVRPLAPPDTVKIAKDERRSLAGAWAMNAMPVLEIENFEKRLLVRLNGVAYQMFPVSESMFYVPGLHFYIGFAKHEKNSIERIYVSTNFGEWWGGRSASTQSQQRTRGPPPNPAMQRTAPRSDA
jgi:CubicO group peptidase (beta-lactamase class C family)